jgi:diacylglycerol kinase (ATP)
VRWTRGKPLALVASVIGMNMHNNSGAFSFSGRIRSVTHAVHGIFEMLKSQHNAWVHAIATIAVIICGFLFSISKSEWCFLILAIALVWVAEALNTAFEFLCDVASPDFHPVVKHSKDVAAGAVLLSAVGAVIIGLIIFIPYAVSYL